MELGRLPAGQWFGRTGNVNEMDEGPWGLYLGGAEYPRSGLSDGRPTVTDNVWIEIGEARYKINASHLPPVGAKMPVRLNFDCGEMIEVVVLGLDWSVDAPVAEKENPRLRVVIRTRPFPMTPRPAPTAARTPVPAARPASALASPRR